MNNNYVLLGLSILAIASIYLFWLNFKQSREIQNLWSQIGQVGGDTPGIQEEFIKKIEQLGGNLDQLNKYVFGDLLPRLEEQEKFIVHHHQNNDVRDNDLEPVYEEQNNALDLKQEDIDNIEEFSENENDSISESNLKDRQISDFDDTIEENTEIDINSISELTMENISNLEDLNFENGDIYNINDNEDDDNDNDDDNKDDDDDNDNDDNDNDDDDNKDDDNKDDDNEDEDENNNDEEHNPESNIEDMDFDDMDFDMLSIKVNLDSDKSNNLSTELTDTTKVINITSNNNHNDNSSINDIVLKPLEDTTMKELKEIAKIVGIKSKGNKEDLYNSISSKLNDN